jgi:protein TonB
MKNRLKDLILTGLFSVLVFNTNAQSGITVRTETIDKDSVVTKDSINTRIEISAKFMEGDINVFRDWVQQNLVYPQEAVKQKIFCKILVKFSIDENGKLYQAEIHQGVHPLIDNEAIRVILSSPLWEPAKLNGEDVKQSFIMPVIFLLTNKFIKSHSK